MIGIGQVLRTTGGGFIENQILFRIDGHRLTIDHCPITALAARIEINPFDGMKDVNPIWLAPNLRHSGFISKHFGGKPIEAEAECLKCCYDLDGIWVTALDPNVQILGESRVAVETDSMTANDQKAHFMGEEAS